MDPVSPEAGPLPGQLSHLVKQPWLDSLTFPGPFLGEEVRFVKVDTKAFSTMTVVETWTGR